MRALQKEARFNLLVSVTTVALTALAALVISQFFKSLNPEGAFGCLGLLGVTGATPLFYRKQRHDTEVVVDERDREIGQRATVHAFGVFWIFFIGACVLPGLINGWQGTVSYMVLALVGVAGWLVQLMTRSISILLQYREG